MSRFLLALALVGAAGALPAAELASQLRRPVGLAPLADGQFWCAANRDSGTLSVVDLVAGRVIREVKIGARLSDLVAVPGTNRLLATDEAAHELIFLDCTGGEVRVEERLGISPYPVSICLSVDGKLASIGSLWSRRLTFVDLTGEPRIARVIDLPFAPRTQLLLAGRNRLIVGDAFGGQLAIVDPAEQTLLGVRQFPGHNIRGLGHSPDGKMLIVAHQLINDLAHSIRNDIHWGLLMSNDLRWLEVDAVLAGGKELYHGAHMHPLGEAGRGGGDPGSLAVAASGTVCVAISGVHEVAIGKEGDFSMQRLTVGRRPTAVRIAADGRTAFIANTLDDSISVVDLTERQVTKTISLGPLPGLSLAQQGELLFYDARLSHDNWMSCHSCHTDGHTSGERNDNFSDKSFGAPKRVLSLLGVRDTLPLAWNGQVQTIQRQIENSVEKTMQREEPLPREEVKALVAYLQTLETPPSLDALRGTADVAAIDRGRSVFAARDCHACHAAPNYTTPETYDVGITDSQGNKQFNPPSLRGLSQRGPYFHDNSAATLEEVFQKHRHPSGTKMSADEIRDLAAFLRSL
ncbi:MAG: cytochrome c peroxidase [Pirellulaceae bacterium]|nr:cytochrome c peroxidase [Pirellulaceae bacterium]